MTNSISLEQFIYTLHPKDGNYDITASSSGIDKREWRIVCKPPPVGNDELKKISPIFSMQIINNQIASSLFTLGLQDKWGRLGIYSHHIIIPVNTYLEIGALPAVFLPLFIVDFTKEGDLPPIVVNSDDLPSKQDEKMSVRIDSNVQEMILDALLKGNTLTLVCPEMKTESMVKLASKLYRLLPLSARIIPFITSPLSRDFLDTGGGKRFLLKMVPERPAYVPEKEQCIDIGQAYDTSKTPDLQSGAARYFVEAYNQSGDEGLSESHKKWEKIKNTNSESASSEVNFVAAMSVNQGTVSLDKIKEMLAKGKKEDAKLYIRAFLDGQKLKNAGEFVEIFALLMEAGSSKVLDSDIERFINATKGIEPSERLTVFENLLNKYPRLSNELFARLKTNYGDSLLRGIKDMSLHPTISSRLFKVDNFDILERVSLGLLKGVVTDAALFEKNLKFTMDKVRSQFAERSFDFVRNLILNFPEYKNAIINQLQIDDIIPDSMKSSLPGSVKQFLLLQIDKILQVLKEKS